MTAASVPAVYARALLDLAAERGELPAVLEACRGLAESLTAASITLIDNPRIDKPTAKRVLRQVFAAGAPRTVADFLELLLDRNRLPDAPTILREAVRAGDAEAGRLVVKVVAAQQVHFDSFQTAIQAFLGPQARIDVWIDPRLIGGATIRLGDVLVDASVSRHLSELTTRMHSAPLADRLWDGEGVPA